MIFPQHDLSLPLSTNLVSQKADPCVNHSSISSTINVYHVHSSTILPYTIKSLYTIISCIHPTYCRWLQNPAPVENRGENAMTYRVSTCFSHPKLVVQHFSTIHRSKVRPGHPLGAAGGGARGGGSGAHGAAGWAVPAAGGCTKFALQGEAAGDLAV